MNIKQAKEQIQNAMKAYFTKDTFGNYLIPIERQRPIFLMGPPGIGKTAIMEQVASELESFEHFSCRRWDLNPHAVASVRF